MPAKPKPKTKAALRPPVINPYLAFNGDCRQAFEFYAKVLGGKIVMMMTYGDMPAGSGPPPSPATKNRIMHARMMLGDLPLMGGDAPPDHTHKVQGYSVSIGVGEPKEADRIFKALSEGGTIMMPIAETFWAHRFGMLTDRYGTPWMVNCEKSGPTS